jgi:biotin carboxyl carrier protein
LVALGLWLHALPALASPGHDHGHDHGEDALPVVAEAEPRLSAMSQNHEMVGVVQGDELVIWINRFADSAPVTDAQVDVTIDAVTARAMLQADGTFHVPAGPLAGHEEAEAAGEPVHDKHDVLVLVTTPEGIDILTAGLSHDHEPHEAEVASAIPGWIGVGLAGLGGGVALGGVAFALLRRSRAQAAAGLAVAIAGMLAVQAPDATASPGHDHDHGEEAAAPTGGDSARRLPDGALFVPMGVQRTLGVRTAIATVDTAPVSVTLNGRVIADPNAGGVVQPIISGRLMPPQGGFSELGTPVSAGQVLAYVEPAVESADRTAQAQEAAAIAAELATAQSRYARMQRMEGAVSQAAIEEARLAVEGLERRRDALASGRVQREALRAPVSGVIANAMARAGEVVEARAMVFEIIDPQRLQVEASVSDGRALADTASADAGGVVLKLQRLGIGGVDAAGASLIRFRIVDGAGGVRLNQPVSVLATTARTVSGVSAPRAAITRSANGQSVVFVKPSPERIEPRVITFETVSAGQVVITDGVAAGERVVVTGAQLLAQIR